MEKWISTTLGDICDIKIGRTPSRANPLYWDTNNSEENYWVSIKIILLRGLLPVKTLSIRCCDNKN